MVTLVVLCPYCQSDRLVHNGKAADGLRDRYLCRICGRRSTQDARLNGSAPEPRETILRAAQERAACAG